METIRKKENKHFILNALKCDTILNELKTLKSGIDVLDLGCGMCFYWYELFDELKFKSITGVDVVQANVDFKNILVGSYKQYHFHYTEDNLKGELISEPEFDSTFHFKREDVFEFLEQCNQEFDFIILSNFLHLFPKPKQDSTIQKVTDLIRPNGYLYINSFQDSELDKIKYSRTEMEQILKSIGYEILLSESTLNLITFHILAKKINLK